MNMVANVKQFSAGLIQTALVAPWEHDGASFSVGPVALLAHALPLDVEPGALPPDFDVRPHPHVGLVAVTYLFAGHCTHRDSLGSRAELAPGDVGYTVAGRGVVHSERFERLRLLGGRLELLQILLALPDGAEEVEPSFTHVSAAEVPETRHGDVTVRRIAGADTALAFPSPLLLHDVRLASGGRYEVPPVGADRALYVIAGAIDVDGVAVTERQSARLPPGPVSVHASGPAHVIAFGGEPVGPRYAWWNFLHSDLARIEEAKAAWRAGSTPLPPGDTESFTPAPPDDGRPLQRFNGAP